MGTEISFRPTPGSTVRLGLSLNCQRADGVVWGGFCVRVKPSAEAYLQTAPPTGPVHRSDPTTSDGFGLLLAT